VAQLKRDSLNNVACAVRYKLEVTPQAAYDLRKFEIGVFGIGLAH